MTEPATDPAHSSTSARPAAEIAAEFGLSYHLDLLELVDREHGIAGRRVLEIGGSLPEELVNGHFRAERWVAVDDFEEYRVLSHRGHDIYGRLNTRAKRDDLPILDVAGSALPGVPWSRFDGDAGDLSPAFDGRFDLVVSIATLEHVADLPATLSAMRRALEPGGIAALLVGPVWSGPRGHHVYASYFPDFAEQTRAFLAELEPWGHLLGTRSEMFARNRSRFGAPFAELVNYCIYESPHLNRLFADEYFDFLDLAGFRTLRRDGWPSDGLPRKLLNRVRKRYPAHSHFELEGFTCLLRSD